MKLALVSGASLFVISFVGIALVFDTRTSAGIAFVLGSISFLLVYRAPVFVKELKIGKIEKDMPASLQRVAHALEIGSGFEEALLLEPANSYSGKELREMARTIKKGIPPHHAFKIFKRKYQSGFLEKAWNALQAEYERGIDSKILGIIARRESERQSLALKEYSQKLTIYSLVFIAVSALLPALFQTFIIVGSSFMEIPFTPEQYLTIVTVGFPLLNLSVIGFIYYKRPRFV